MKTLDRIAVMTLSAAGLAGVALLLAADPDRPAGIPPATVALARPPVAFVPNLGQWDHRARYVARFPTATVFLREDGWTARFVDGEDREAVVRMHFLGAARAELRSEDRLAGIEGHFLGDDPSRWHGAVPRYGRVRYEGLYEGVDVVAYENDGRFEYDLVLVPGAALDDVRIEVEGTTALRVDADGALVLDTPAGAVRQSAPVAWEVADGRRRPIACSYRLHGAHGFGFEAPSWSGATALTIDPVLGSVPPSPYSTFLGGSGDEWAWAVAVGDDGIVTVGGQTSSADFPTTAPGGPRGGFDAFLLRLDPAQPPAQQLLWSSYFGGSAFDSIEAVVLEPSGVIALVGLTSSRDFPTTPGAFQRSYGGGRYDGFVARVRPPTASNPSLQILASTLLGGNDVRNEWLVDLAVDPARGDVTVVGQSSAADYPVSKGAYDTTFNGGQDVVVTRLDAQLSTLLYSTFIGGPGLDSGWDLTVDGSGVITACGIAEAGFPTTSGAFDTTFNGKRDGFVLRLDPTRSSTQQLVAATFIGGPAIDHLFALHADGTAITVAGETFAPGMPTTPNAFQPSYQGGGGDFYVARLDLGLSTLLYGTHVGGPGFDGGDSLAVDAAGVITVVGYGNAGFPITPGAYNGAGTAWDVAIARLDPTRTGARQLLYSTLVGGRSNEFGNAVALDAAGGAAVVGLTRSVDWPTSPIAAFPTYRGGARDTFLLHLNMLPRGAEPFGASSPGCQGPLAIGVTSMPQVGNQQLSLTCTNAPPSTTGGLVLGSRRATALPVLGIDLWVDPIVVATARSDARGAADFPLPIPALASLANGTVSTQFVWVGSTQPPACPPAGFSASNALQITIQP